MHRLLTQKMKQIQRYLIRLGADRDVAEDIVQETIYKGLLYIDSIHPDKFSAWMFKVALNHYYDLCRKKKWMEIPIEDVAAEGNEAPEELLLQKERREEIERVLEDLTPIYKQLLIMKYELDLSYQEIAGLLGIRMEMVKTYLYRARKQFQKKYGGLHDEDKEFNPDEDGELSKLVKKAKRRSMWRNAGCPWAFPYSFWLGGFFANLQLLYKNADHALRDISMFKAISGPNLYESGYRQNFGFLEGALEYQTYKIVEGIPVVWNKETYEFNVVG